MNKNTLLNCFSTQACVRYNEAPISMYANKKHSIFTHFDRFFLMEFSLLKPLKLCEKPMRNYESSSHLNKRREKNFSEKQIKNSSLDSLTHTAEKYFLKTFRPQKGKFLIMWNKAC